MDNFASLPGSRVPAAVPITEASEEKQQLYKQFANLEKPLAEPGEAVPAPVAAPIIVAQEDPEEQRPDFSDPTPEDKQNFVRSILGSKPYEKVYILFGAVKAHLMDRTSAETENLYTELNKVMVDRKLTEEGTALLLERYQLVSTLQKLEIAPRNMQTFTKEQSLEEKVTAILALPKPLYRALMETGRTFEEHVDILTNRALEANFWQTGGAASR